MQWIDHKRVESLSTARSKTRLILGSSTSLFVSTFMFVTTVIHPEELFPKDLAFRVILSLILVIGIPSMFAGGIEEGLALYRLYKRQSSLSSLV